MIGDYKPLLLGCPFCGKPPEVLTGCDPGDCPGEYILIHCINQYCRANRCEVRANYFADGLVRWWNGQGEWSEQKAYAQMLEKLLIAERVWNTRAASETMSVSPKKYGDE